MERTISNNITEKIGERVELRGWMYSLRLLGAVNFLLLRDRGGLVQIVIEDKGELAKIKDLQPGSILHIKGDVQKAKQTELGAEIINPEIEVDEPITESWPIDITKGEIEANLDTLLDYRALSLRHPKTQAIFKIQASIVEAFAESMKNQGFTRFVSPVLMGAPSESGADVFEVKYFDNKAYLAQSPQVYKQIMTGVFERVYTIAKVFRAEKHNTSRHLMEITQLDGEMGFIDTYDEVLDVVERVVRDIFNYLELNNKKDIKLLGIELPKIPEGAFPRLKVKEALKIVEERVGKSSEREELDVDPEDEREIGKWALEKHGSDFLWLLNFKAEKNFYTWNNIEDPDESLSYDLVCRGLEWLSGTHRIHKYEILLDRLKSQGLDPENYSHYLQAFEYGMPSEAGFSFGLERMTQQIVGATNIREATLFPSDLKRVAAARIKSQLVRGEDSMVNKIKEILDSRNIEYNYLEHDETVTSEDAAKVRGTSLGTGVKALILKSKKSEENIMVCIPGDKRIDFKKVKTLLGEAYTMESPDVINDKYGLEVGGVPPFGNLLGIPVYFDKEIAKKEEINFNCGSKYKSIEMLAEDLVDVIDSELENISK